LKAYTSTISAHEVDGKLLGFRRSDTANGPSGMSLYHTIYNVYTLSVNVISVQISKHHTYILTTRGVHTYNRWRLKEYRYYIRLVGEYRYYIRLVGEYRYYIRLVGEYNHPTKTTQADSIKQPDHYAILYRLAKR
jgi:hypothetical protein